MWIEHISGRIPQNYKLFEFTKWFVKKAMTARMPRYDDDISFDNAKKSSPSHKRDRTMSATTIQTKKCIYYDEDLQQLST